MAEPNPLTATSAEEITINVDDNTHPINTQPTPIPSDDEDGSPDEKLKEGSIKQSTVPTDKVNGSPNEKSETGTTKTTGPTDNDELNKLYNIIKDIK